MNEILEALDKAENKGALFEKVLETALIDNDYSNVARQKSGSQYGFDILAQKDGEWFRIECKNLRKEAGIADLAPKLLWHEGVPEVYHFVIASTKGISNDLRYRLESNPLSLEVHYWNPEYLSDLISQSPKALKFLDLLLEGPKGTGAKPEVFRSTQLKFVIKHNLAPPYSFDYFIHNDMLVKAFNDYEFSLFTGLRNTTNIPLIIHDIRIKQ